MNRYMSIVKLAVLSLTLLISTKSFSITLDEYNKYKKSLDLMVNMGYIQPLEYYEGLFEKAKNIEDIEAKEAVMATIRGTKKNWSKNKNSLDKVIDTYKEFEAPNIDYDYLRTLYKTGVCHQLKFRASSVASCFANHYLYAKGDYVNALLWYLESRKQLKKSGSTFNSHVQVINEIKNKIGTHTFNTIKNKFTYGELDIKDINLWLFNESGQKNIVNRKNINKKVMDKTSPTIVTYNNSIKTTYDKYVVLAGKVLDDSKIAKLIINEKEYSLNGEKPGEFSITEYIQLGENKFNIYAEDVFGNNNTKVVSIHRKKPATANQDKKLSPPKNIKFKNPDAVALIIGVDNYESISNAPWAETDANVFYDFAQNALGIPNEKIKLITGYESSEAGIWKAVERWLPTEVNKNKSDLYVYFAGHGLASADGDKAYLIPWDGDPELLERTSILRSELIEGLKDLKPKSVTMFMDTCYSGRTKGGSSTLVADARGLRIVKKNKLNNLPKNFTLFSAAGNDETASSHPTLKHGLFSYWMMKGLGGDADSNNDKKITNAELYAFINKNVQKSAISMGRKQNPQMTGEADRVISTW